MATGDKERIEARRGGAECGVVGCSGEVRGERVLGVLRLLLGVLMWLLLLLLPLLCEPELERWGAQEAVPRTRRFVLG